MKNHFWILLLACFVLSCEKDELSEKKDENDSYIIFGHFYGECLGEKCVENFKLTNTHLFEETTDPYTLMPGTGTFVELDHSKFEQVKSLATMIPQQLLNTNDITIGSPDTADGGGIYFETKVNGEPKYWRIDKVRSNFPDYLIPFVEEIEKNIALLQN
jgi:hypothetical protein